MTFAASYQLNNWWHGLGHVGHILLAVIGVVIICAALYSIFKRR